MRQNHVTSRIHIDHNLLSYVDEDVLGCNSVFDIIHPAFRRNIFRQSSVPKGKPTVHPYDASGNQNCKALQLERSLPSHNSEKLKCSALNLLLSGGLLGFLLNIKFIFNMQFARFVYLCTTALCFRGKQFSLPAIHFTKFR
jgi:hypothetical protein